MDFGFHGYRTLGTGNVFHGHDGEHGEDKGQWAFDEYQDGPRSSNAALATLTSSKGNVINSEAQAKPYLLDGKKPRDSAGGATQNPAFEQCADCAKAA